jgi:hypothetical protein
MNHIRKFLSYKSKKNGVDVVKESVLQVDDTYKVRVIVDVKKSFVNSYIKKVSDNTQKNLRDFYSDMDIVEELVKHVVETNMNVDTIPATILVGGSQVQPQAQMQVQPQAEPQDEPQAQVQTEPAQDFEEVQPESQEQAQSPEGEAQVQPAQEEEETGEEEELPG